MVGKANKKIFKVHSWRLFPHKHWWMNEVIKTAKTFYSNAYWDSRCCVVDCWIYNIYFLYNVKSNLVATLCVGEKSIIYKLQE